MTKMTEELIDEIVNELEKSLDKDETESLKSCPESELIMYHHSAGRYIRNTYKLWTYEWEPQLIEGVDHSPNHPDAVSMKIIKMLWDRLQK